MGTSDNNLGENLRGLRKSCRLSQERLAEEMGVDPKTIGNLENGVTGLSSTMVHKYMEVFHCDANSLFCISEKGITHTVAVTESTASFRRETRDGGDSAETCNGAAYNEAADEDMAEIISIDRLLNTVDPVGRKYLRNTMVMMITEFPA